MSRLELRSADFRPRPQNVYAEKVSRTFPVAGFYQLQYAKVFTALERKTTAIDGDAILDESPQPIDSPKRIQEEIILRTSDEHFMEYRIGLEHLRPGQSLVTTIEKELLFFARLTKRLLIDLKGRKWLRVQ